MKAETGQSSQVPNALGAASGAAVRIVALQHDRRL